jgi:glycosyltransferase involved in cell wall biosynthesis
MGYGPLAKKIQEKAGLTSTIFYHPVVNHNAVLNYSSSADYGVSFTEDSCLNHRYCLPNKIFEYLMAGLPLITSNLPEMKSLIEAESVGVVAQENTVEGFRQAVRESLGQDYKIMQESVFEARKKYCWEEQEKILKEVYDAL